MRQAFLSKWRSNHAFVSRLPEASWKVRLKPVSFWHFSYSGHLKDKISCIGISLLVGTLLICHITIKDLFMTSLILVQSGTWKFILVETNVEPKTGPFKLTGDLKTYFSKPKQNLAYFVILIMHMSSNRAAVTERYDNQHINWHACVQWTLSMVHVQSVSSIKAS